MIDFNTVTKFEQTIADFFGAPYAVATDSCTHAIELSLRLESPDKVACPARTYISVPMTLAKLQVDWYWDNTDWDQWYQLQGSSVIDAATLWERSSYLPGTKMCISFQARKKLPLGRGGIILLDNQQEAEILRAMAYDGRYDRTTSWQEQKIAVMGYHYYMTPETADQGLTYFQTLADTPWAAWNSNMYPYLPDLPVFK